MEFVLSDGVTVVDRQALGEAFPNVSLPEVLTLEDAQFLGVSIVIYTQPPVCQIHQVAVRDGVVQDGDQWYTKWRLDDLPPNEQAGIRFVAERDVVEKIKKERDRRKFNGVFLQTKWIHTDTFSRTQWLAMKMMGDSIPIIPWTTMDGSTIMTSAQLATDVFVAVAQMDVALHANAKAHIDAVNGHPDPNSYDYSTEWLPTYGG